MHIFMQMQRGFALLAVGLTLVAAQPFQPGQNLVPLGEHISSFLLLTLKLQHVCACVTVS